MADLAVAPQQQQYVAPPDPNRGPGGYPSWEAYQRDFNRARAESQFMQESLQGARSIDEQIQRINTAKRFIATRRLEKMVEAGVPIGEALQKNPALWSDNASLMRSAAAMMPGAADSFQPGEATVLNDPSSGDRMGILVRTSKGAVRPILDPQYEHLTPSAKGSVYSTLINSVDTSIKALSDNPDLSPDQMQSNLAELTRQRQGFIDELKKLVHEEGVPRTVRRQPQSPVPESATAPSVGGVGPASSALTQKIYNYVPGKGLSPATAK